MDNKTGVLRTLLFMKINIFVFQVIVYFEVSCVLKIYLD